MKGLSGEGFAEIVRHPDGMKAVPVNEEQGGLGVLSHNSADDINWSNYDGWFYTAKEREQMKAAFWANIVAKAMTALKDGGSSGNGGSTGSTTFYDQNGNVLGVVYGTGHSYAYIVKDEYVSLVKAALQINNNSPVIEHLLVMANSSGKLGDIYDLESINEFYEENVNKYPVKKIDGKLIDKMENIRVGGKSKSKEYLKGLKGAEASFMMVRNGNVWVVDKHSIQSNNNLTGSPPGYAGKPHGHLHPGIPELEGKTITFNYPGFSKRLEYGPFWRSAIPSDPDMNWAGREGKHTGTLRNVLVNGSHIYLYTANSSIQISR